MCLKGFTAIVGKLHIHAMRSVASREMLASQSDAQWFHVYRRTSAGLELEQREKDFDSALDYCLRSAVFH